MYDSCSSLVDDTCHRFVPLGLILFSLWENMDDSALLMIPIKCGVIISQK